RNGVLLFVAPRSRSFAVVGDAAIHARLGPEFWHDVAAAMEADFRGGRYTDGIVKGVARVGDALAAHFPRQARRTDLHALPDEASEDCGLPPRLDHPPWHRDAAHGHRGRPPTDTPVALEGARPVRGQGARAEVQAVPGLLARPHQRLVAQRLVRG